MAESLTLALRRLVVAVPDRRFGIAFATLAVAGCASLALWRVDLASDSSGGSRAAWSSWQPRSIGFKAAEEIAEHVAAANIGVQHVPIALPVPIRGGRSQHGSAGGKRGFSALVVHERGGGLRIFAHDTIAFSLCGTGRACTLGFDAHNQHLLARREGLELALYSFTYLGLDRLLVLLPPRPGADRPLRALLYRRTDLASSLRRPLRATLGGKPPTESQLDGAIGRRLDRMTAPYLYSVEQIAAPDGSAPVLTLSPLEER